MIKAETGKQSPTQEIENSIATIVGTDPPGLQQVAICHHVCIAYLLFVTILTGQASIYIRRASDAQTTLAMFADADSGLVGVVVAIHFSFPDDLQNQFPVT